MNEKDLLCQIGEIRRQLWKGHASLMVGSGFSRNAGKASPHTPTPPDWIGLADKLIAALYPRYSPQEQEKIRVTKSVLQLADEFEASFQRPALNELLKNAIQDENLIPSPLHIKMLEFPWSDVFTTNYDTLLERAAKQIINIKYDVVLDSKDLPNSESPRIIKLHGSFPTEATHLIITGEDYRTYPIKYSPFVNSVQQAIMESTLCLIGFSGTDPNFQKWIGWVKDNLGKSMLPIYLIGLLNLSASERRLLESKKIIPVDLSNLHGVPADNHNVAIARFFEILDEKPLYIDWPKNNSLNSLSPRPRMTETQLVDIINSWTEERLSYPKWIVLPWLKRQNMITFTERWSYDIGYLVSLPAPWDLRGLYEFDWRMSKCLMPIFNNLIDNYEKILNRYDSWGLQSSEKNDKELQGIWLDLCFSILRWSREELDKERWERYLGIIKKLVSGDIYLQNRMFYEEALFALALPDMEALNHVIKNWDKIEHPCGWQVHFASLLSMTGEYDRAISLWMDALNYLRPRVPKSKIKDDFYLLGIEGSILVSLCMSEQYKEFTPGTENQGGGEQRRKYRERLRELEQYGCNPWENLDKFKLSLRAPVPTVAQGYCRNFNSISSSEIYRTGWELNSSQAYQFLRFLEEIGIPYTVGNVNIANDVLSVALSQIANVSPGWAFSILNIIGTSNNVTCELVFSQEKLFHIKSKKINKLIDNYINQLNYIISNKREYLTRFSNNYYSKTAKNLYEAISRLTVKASPENLQKIFDLGLVLYSIDDGSWCFQHLASHYFQRVFTAMSPQKILDNLNALLSIRIPRTREGFWEPAPKFIDWRNYKWDSKVCSPQLSETINHLCSDLDTGDSYYRSQILVYLHPCFEANLLSRAQKTVIASKLSKDDESLLSVEHLYPFAYKMFLGTSKFCHSVDACLLTYYLDKSKSLFDTENGNLKIAVNADSSFIKMSHSLLATCSVFSKGLWPYFELSLGDCKQLFENINVAWRNVPKDLLGKLNDSDCSNERAQIVQRTFYRIDLILGEIILPRAVETDWYPDVIKFISELREYFDCPIASVATFVKSGDFDSHYLAKTIVALSGTDEIRFKHFSHSVLNAYRFFECKQLPPPPDCLFFAFVHAINMKSDRTFCAACGTLGSILNFFPPPEMGINLLLASLEDLLQSTSFSGVSKRFLMQDRNDYRQAASFLAVCLYKFYLRTKRKLPVVLQTWHDLANSVEELPEIRNTWIRELIQTH